VGLADIHRAIARGPASHLGPTRRRRAHVQASALAGEEARGGAIAFGRRHEEEEGETEGSGRMDLGIAGEDATGVFAPAATAGRPSDLIRRLQEVSKTLGSFWPRRGAAFPAQAQVAAWCAGQQPRARLTALGWAALGRDGPPCGLDHM
jgi:hypothetical protein